MSRVDIPFSHSKTFPLVPRPTGRFDEGYGLHAEFDRSEDLRRYLSEFNEEAQVLTEINGALILSSKDEFRMDGAVKGSAAEPLKFRTLPWHVDTTLTVSTHFSERSALHPEGWGNGITLLWQDAMSDGKGRKASTLVTAPGAIETTIKRFFSCAPEQLLEEGFLEVSELNRWRLIRSVFLEKKPPVSSLATVTVMHFTDIMRIFGRLKGDHSPSMDLLERFTEKTIQVHGENILEVDWSLPQHARGAAMLMDCASLDGEDPPLVHTRWNKYGPLWEPTVFQATLYTTESNGSVIGA